ncbi:MAG: hypothetical protein PHC99_10115 [Methylococcales bacterium]|nr:hypothetical protein [Methylococcales bacterium]
MSKAFQFNGTSYVSSLPFINTQTGNWFDVTPTGDEITDLNIGLNCALLLLKAVSKDNQTNYNPEDPNAPIILPCVVESLMKQDSETFKNVVRGFFFMIDTIFQASAPKLTPELNKLSYDELIAENYPVIH